MSFVDRKLAIAPPQYKFQLSNLVESLLVSDHDHLGLYGDCLAKKEN